MFNVTGWKMFVFCWKYRAKLGKPEENQFRQREGKANLSWKLKISNTARKVVGATLSESFPSGSSDWLQLSVRLAVYRQRGLV